MAFIHQCYCLLCSILILILGYFVSNVLSRPLDGNNITLSMRDKHERWMTTYGRTYKDLIEKQKRLKIFKKNVEHIENFNRASTSNHILYTLGVNKFADLTNEEFIATYTGTKSFSPLQSMFVGATTTNFKYANISNIPPSMDWREKGAVTAVKDQRKCGSCWAFAVVATMEGLHKITTGKLNTFSVQELVDCDHNNSGCNGGYIVRAFRYIMNSQGIVTDVVYPYRGKTGRCQTQLKGERLKINGFEGVPSGLEYSLLKAVSQQPVAVDMYHEGLRFYKGGIFNGPCGTTKTHSVTIVGYGTENGTDYWLVKNSWGNKWGEKGYFRILRGYNICGLSNMPFYPI